MGRGEQSLYQGVAKETDDPDIVAATVVLRRPVGSDGPFRENAELPSDLAGPGARRPGKVHAKPKSKKHPPRKSDDKADRKAALEFERRRKEEAAREKEHNGARRRSPRRGRRWRRPSGSTRRR